MRILRTQAIRTAIIAGCLLLVWAIWPREANVSAAPVAREVAASTLDQVRDAIRAATPGTRILIAPGTYPGGMYFEGLRGEAGRPIVIAAADPANPPVISGGGSGIQLVNPWFVELHNLRILDAKSNGVSIDDGGKYSPDARGIVLKGLRVKSIGPRGNCDGIKLSGLTGFAVENCVVEDWGIGSGSAIDMVGCHKGVIAGCTFKHQPGLAATGGNGVQTKGGSSEITIRRNRFEHAGTRAVNLGGSTGNAYFRPPLEQWPAGIPHSEARKIEVQGNIFIGSMAPIAFAGVDGASVRLNTIYVPGKWAFRILQETRDPSFVPCRNGMVADNLIVFSSSAWAENGLNIGPGTEPMSFTFARNFWYCLDNPALSKPKLPKPELDGTYGQDPQFVDEKGLDLRLRPGSPAKGRGADGMAL